MKTTILAAMTLIAFTAFAQKSNIDQDIKMYSQVWDDVINKGDINKINSTHFDESVIGISNPENLVGIEAFKSYYQNFLTGFSDRNFEIINVFGQNDNIVKHWRFTGKHTGKFFGILTTGKNVNIEGVTLVKMKNGKILQEHDFMDNTIFMQQLGLASDPKNVSVIDNLYKAFATGDIPAVLGSMDAKIVWNEAESNSLADGNPYIGPDAVLNGIFVRLGGMYEGFKLKDIELHDMSNNQVLATLRYEATVKTTGKKIDAQVAHLWELNGNGEIITFQQYTDTKKIADAEMK